MPGTWVWPKPAMAEDREPTDGGWRHPPHPPECGLVLSTARVSDLSDAIVFEQPLTERARTWLRLEFLFQQRRHHTLDASAWSLRASLQGLLDIIALTARSDLKSEVIKEIQDQQVALARVPGLLVGLDTPTVQQQLHDSLRGVQKLSSHFAGSVLRSHEFLDAVAKRSAIPGGAAPFDLPALHRWLAEPPMRVRDDLNRWFAHFAPYEQAIETCLRVLRHSGRPLTLTAQGGVHLHLPQGAHQLLRVTVNDRRLYPEISAGRHRYSLRFMSQTDVDARPQQVQQDVPFRLQCCSLLPL